MQNLTKIAVVFILFLAVACSNSRKTKQKEAGVELINDEKNQRVDILIDGKPFTSYLYTDTLPLLKKTILYPVRAASGTIITRGHPLKTREGERPDEPHHVGVWFDYSDVNGIDFWNSSDAITGERLLTMGTIRHESIRTIKSGKDKGILEVTMNWLGPDGQKMLHEDTRFVFSGDNTTRIIDRTTTLTALDKQIVFNDSKDGLMAIRVCRELEHPSKEPVLLSGPDGKPHGEPKVDSTGVTGHYLNSEGVEGTAVWGKRAKWVQLSGIVNDEPLSVVIFDNPQNVGYPAYWHARGYGLFSINPLGQAVFSEGKETLNLTLEPGESVTFRFRLLVLSGTYDAKFINKLYSEYVNSSHPPLKH